MEGNEDGEREGCVWLGYYTAQCRRQYTAFGHVAINGRHGGAGELLCDEVLCDVLCEMWRDEMCETVTDERRWSQ